MTNDPSIFIFDDLQPEDNAMVQSLYSRSPDSVLAHRAKVEEVGSGKFMDQFYIGYGHGSIGDCGTTTVFEENVSMLVAKATQDNRLYNGQEASTRYLDFSVQPQYDPYNHPASKRILQQWLELYNRYRPLVIAGLKIHHPFDPETDRSEKLWDKTIEVRAFDILRSLLPIGTTTLLSWHTNLRQARDHLRYLLSHPLTEVQNIVAKVFNELKTKYPNSFDDELIDLNSERYRERNEYDKRNARDTHYLTPEMFLDSLTSKERRVIEAGYMVTDSSLLDPDLNLDEAIVNRPRGARLPRRLLKYGIINANFLLDFGSFRDLQRHRDGYCPVPLVTNQFGFYKSYLVELQRVLDSVDYQALETAIGDLLTDIERLPDQGIETNRIDNQYLYPMGMAVGCTLAYSLPQMVYVAELRSGKTVHFTLRPIAHQLANSIQVNCPALNLYVDFDEDSFTTKRGEQDITAKTSN